MTHYLAIDLGAESGRVMLGALSEDRLDLKELHRFPIAPVKQNGSLHWDIPRLFENIKAGLKKASEASDEVAGISADSWGVDYMIFDEEGELVPPTFHYRDPRADQGVKNALKKVSQETIFSESGVQFMPINTLFQLAAEAPERLAKASLILGIGDGFNYLLSDVAKAEASLASTFQLYNPIKGQWSDLLIEKLDFPGQAFPEIVASGSRLGPLKASIAEETGIQAASIIASCSHDTGAAVAAVPASGDHWAYLSSGTWSLMGVERSEPIITDECREHNFTNEIGYGNSVRLLKNITGLWLVQECRREWEKENQRYDYATLTRLASEVEPFRSLIDPADPRFVSPDGMPQRIADYCRETGQPAPETPGAFVRCALESLALLYRQTLLQIEELTQQKITRLHVVGGGSKNTLLNQLTANALNVPVLAGPVEATAMGNILVQALALGHLDSLDAGRKIVRRSVEMQTFEPAETNAWDPQFERFQKLRAAG